MAVSKEGYDLQHFLNVFEERFLKIVEISIYVFMYVYVLMHLYIYIHMCYLQFWWYVLYEILVCKGDIRHQLKISLHVLCGPLLDMPKPLALLLIFVSGP